jgi:ATP-binding cassette subfamily C protein CydD
MDVLRIAFLSSAVLEFFTSISIALTAVYFGFNYIGEMNFGYYGAGVSLLTGLFVLILAPEFYQPLRDLGTFYHAKQQAIGAAESIVDFLQYEVHEIRSGSHPLPQPEHIIVEADDLEILSPQGKRLVGPISFTLDAHKTTALVGPSGAGKTSLVQAILGFMPYRGHLRINGVELHDLSHDEWRQHISWVGQNPLLVHGSIRDNVTLGKTQVSEKAMHDALTQSFAAEFVKQHGLDYGISDRSGGLSVGQAQRLALARAILQNGTFWLLDEPTASLDARSEQLVMQGLAAQMQQRTTLFVTHQLAPLQSVDQILVMQHGELVQTGDYASLSSQDGLFSTLLAASQTMQSDSMEGNLDA